MSAILPGRSAQRQSVLLLGAVLVVTALSWLYLIRMAMMMPGMSGDGVPFLPTFLMWSVMMAAMMLPSAVPSIAAMLALERRARGSAGTGPYLFAGGYLIAWVGFSVFATLGQQGLYAVALLSPMMRLDSPVVAGGLLLAAGVFQWTPLKEQCLYHCRSPYGLIAGGWTGGAAPSLGLGLRQGLYCIGCCWALMLLMFVFGVMSVLWMAALTAFILAEKVLPPTFSRHFGRLTGVLLGICGLWLALGGIR